MNLERQETSGPGHCSAAAARGAASPPGARRSCEADTEMGLVQATEGNPPAAASGRKRAKGKVSFQKRESDTQYNQGQSTRVFFIMETLSK